MTTTITIQGDASDILAQVGALFPRPAGAELAAQMEKLATENGTQRQRIAELEARIIELNDAYAEAYQRAHGLEQELVDARAAAQRPRRRKLAAAEEAEPDTLKAVFQIPMLQPGEAIVFTLESGHKVLARFGGAVEDAPGKVWGILDEHGTRATCDLASVQPYRFSVDDVVAWDDNERAVLSAGYGPILELAVMDGEPAYRIQSDAFPILLAESALRPFETAPPAALEAEAIVEQEAAGPVCPF